MNEPRDIVQEYMNIMLVVLIIIAMFVLGVVMGSNSYEELNDENENLELALTEAKRQAEYYRVAASKYEEALDKYETVVVACEYEFKLRALERQADSANPTPGPRLPTDALDEDTRWEIGFTNDLSGERYDTENVVISWPSPSGLSFSK